MFEGRHEILVDRITLAIKPLLEVHVRGEAAPLLGRIGQLAERGGELEPGDVDLEALADPRVAGLRP